MLLSALQSVVVIVLVAVTGIQASGSVELGTHYSISTLPVPVQGVPVLQVQPLYQSAYQSSVYPLSPVLVPYAAGTPLKILFSQFPPRVESLVQRVQNYFSHYNYPHLIPVPQLPPTPAGTIPAASDSTNSSALPLTTTSPPSPTTPATTTSTTTTTTARTATIAAAGASATSTELPPTPSPSPSPSSPIDNSASTGGLDYDLPPSPDNPGAGYRYDPPRKPFNYPTQPRFHQQQRNGYFSRS